MISGTADADALSGGDGNDVLLAGAGDDTVFAGAGDDHLRGEEGHNHLLGGAGDDWFFVETDSLGDMPINVMHGGAGTDRLDLSRYDQTGDFHLVWHGAHLLPDGSRVSGIEELHYTGGAGADVISGGAFADELGGSEKGGADVLRGLGGDDMLWAYDFGARMFGGAGDDTVLLFTNMAGEAEARGGAGIDVLQLGFYGVVQAVELSVAQLQGPFHLTDKITLAGFERLDVTGGEGDDLFTGGALADQLHGGAGDDTLLGGLGADTLYGDDGRDILTDAGGMTLAYGGAGRDVISGQGSLYGGQGNDVLVGSAGADTLTGDAGADRFVFADAPQTVDVITDFRVGVDVIVLHAAAFAGLDAGHLPEGNDLVTWDSATGGLWFDADGTGGAAAVQFASVTAGLALTLADFLIV